MSGRGASLSNPEHDPSLTSDQLSCKQGRRAGRIGNRSGGDVSRDVEVGCLEEQFVFTLLYETLELPDFIGEGNWTSSLCSRAGLSRFGGCEISDFTYHDTQGALTRYLQQMEFAYPKPSWLSSVCNNDNVPLYQLEVKSTAEQDPLTTFYMSGNQHELAKRLQVTSAIPKEVYVILRILSLHALEDDTVHRRI